MLQIIIIVQQNTGGSPVATSNALTTGVWYTVFATLLTGASTAFSCVITNPDGSTFQTLSATSNFSSDAAAQLLFGGSK